MAPKQRRRDPMSSSNDPEFEDGSKLHLSDKLPADLPRTFSQESLLLEESEAENQASSNSHGDQPPSNCSAKFRVIKDVRYWPESSHPKHVLDIYIPESGASEASPEVKMGDEALFPVVVHVHGGGWQRGDKSHFWRGSPTIGGCLASLGVVVVAISYRLAARRRQCRKMTAEQRELVVRHPEQAHDVAHAVQWVRDYLHEFVANIDIPITGLYLSGHSAGAHLVSLVALDLKYLREADVDPDLVKGVIAISGVYDLHMPMASYTATLLFRVAYGWPTFGKRREQWREASPITYVTKDSKAPPFLVLSAEYDVGLEYCAQNFVDKLRANSMSVDYRTIPGTTHGTISKNFDKHEAHTLAIDFVRSHHKAFGSRSLLKS